MVDKYDPQKSPGIRDSYDPTDEEKGLVRRVYKRKQEMTDAPDRLLAAQHWDKWEKQWEGWREERNQLDALSWQSNHFVPLTSSVVETALAEMVDQTERPLILPNGAEDEPRVIVMKHIYNYTWEVADGDTQLYNIMKDALILGTGIGQEYYFQDRRTVKKTVVDEKGKEKEETADVYDYDDAMMEVVKLQDFFVDEHARGFDGPYAARDCIRRYLIHIDEFRNIFQGPIWDPYGNAKKVVPGGDLNYYEFYKPPQGNNLNEFVEVLWYWSKKPDDFLIIVANDILIKAGPNPYNHKQLPFARAVDVKRVHRFYGKGEAELLESIQDEENTLRRMIIDRNHLDIDKMFLVADTLNLNDEDLIARPHGMIPTSGDVNSAKPIEYGDVPRSVEMSINFLNQDAINVTGIDPRSSAQPQPSTATQAALAKESALKKIRMKLRLLDREFLVRIARLRVSNIIQFYSQPTMEKIVGEKGTAEYKQQIQDLQAQGILVQADGQDYMQSFRQIPMDGKNLMIDETGKLTQESQPGVHFFEARPDLFVPVNRGGYRIKFAAGGTLPTSEALQQTKATEMYDRLIQLALGQVGYDPIKLGDLLLKVNNYDPEEFKTTGNMVTGGVNQMQQPGQPTGPDQSGQPPQLPPPGQAVQGQPGLQPGQSQPPGLGPPPPIGPNQQQSGPDELQLAVTENGEMLKGDPVGPTPFVSPQHTMIHVKFMQSPDFQNPQVSQDIVQIFTKHVLGEYAAQSSRQAGGQNPTTAQQSPSSKKQTIQAFQGQGTRKRMRSSGGNVNTPMQQLMPALMTGGANVPQV